MSGNFGTLGKASGQALSRRVAALETGVRRFERAPTSESRSGLCGRIASLWIPILSRMSEAVIGPEPTIQRYDKVITAAIQIARKSVAHEQRDPCIGYLKRRQHLLRDFHDAGITGVRIRLLQAIQRER
jgi:hypothetical protein